MARNAVCVCVCEYYRGDSLLLSHQRNVKLRIYELWESDYFFAESRNDCICLICTMEKWTVSIKKEYLKWSRGQTFLPWNKSFYSLKGNCDFLSLIFCLQLLDLTRNCKKLSELWADFLNVFIIVYLIRGNTHAYYNMTICKKPKWLMFICIYLAGWC